MAYDSFTKPYLEAARLALLELLSRDPKRRDTAVTGLKKIGPARHAVVPALIRRLADDDEVKRTQARIALTNIDAADVEKLVRSNDTDRVWLDLSEVDGGHVLTLLAEDRAGEQMLAALSSIVTEDPAASLKRSLGSKDENEHACALFLMSRIVWSVDDVRAALERSQRHDSARVRAVAAEGLAYMGKPRAERLAAAWVAGADRFEGEKFTTEFALEEIFQRWEAVRMWMPAKRDLALLERADDFSAREFRQVCRFLIAATRQHDRFRRQIDAR